MQSTFPYWDVPKWTTKPNDTMLKDLAGKCNANGDSVMTTLGVGEHKILGDLIFFVLYATVSGTPFADPTAPVLTIPPTTTHSNIISYSIYANTKKS